MVCMCKCSILILLFLIQQQSSCVLEDTDFKIWVTSNLLEKIRNLENEKSDLLWFQQKVIVNEKQIKNVDYILDCPVTKGNLDKKWSQIYVSLGRYWSQTIKLMLHTENLDESMLYVINDIILKTISVLINFIDIAPNVESHEPGILKLSLWLNLYMVKIIKKMKNENMISIETNSDTERMLQKMINFIERFMISNDHENLINTLSFDALRNDMDITLSNIEFPNNMISDYRSFFEEHRPNNMKFSIIIDRVLNELVNNQILVRPLDVTQTILDIKYDVEDILSYMDLVFNGIIKIFCQIFMNFLRLFANLNRNKNSTDLLKTVIYSWSENDVITEYKAQISYLKSMQFPMRLINIVEFGLRIVHDVIHYNEISNLDVVEKKILQELNDVQINLSSANSELPLPEFKKYNGSLTNFLDTIGSIKAFKYFNLIFKLKQNYDPVVKDLTETVLSKMEIDTSNEQTQKVCQQVQLLYEVCGDMILRIEKFDLKKESLKDKLYPKIKNLSTAIRNIMLLSNDPNHTAVLSLANEYLERNTLIDLSADKMKPIPYFTMNLLDMFQIHGCREPLYRDKALKKTTINITKYLLKFKLSEKSQPEISLFTKLLNKDYVEKFYRGNSQNLLRFYWKGQLQTFNEIVEIVTCSGNPLDHPSFVRYVNVFQIFAVSTLFGEMVYILDYFLTKHATSITILQDEMLIKSAKSLKLINLPECFVPATEALVDIENFKDSVSLIENKIMLKQNLALCGLCHLPDKIVKEYDRQRAVLFNEASSILIEYYNSVMSLQDSDAYKNHHVNKLDTYMMMTFRNLHYSQSTTDDIDDFKFSKSEVVVRMLENILLKEPLPANSDNTDRSTVVIS